MFMLVSAVHAESEVPMLERLETFASAGCPIFQMAS